MNTFDQWRKDYEAMTFEEQVAYHNDLYDSYPEQAHFNLAAFREVLKIVKPKEILEAGPWRADLASIILKENQTIEEWDGFEICQKAKDNCKCDDDRFDYWPINRFDWWEYFPLTNWNLVFGTHFLEHLSDRHAKDLLKNLNDCGSGMWALKAVYFEAPIAMERRDGWDGYVGTHKLNMGWKDICEILYQFKPTFITDSCVLFTTKSTEC